MVNALIEPQQDTVRGDKHTVCACANCIGMISPDSSTHIFSQFELVAIQIFNILLSASSQCAAAKLLQQM